MAFPQPEVLELDMADDRRFGHVAALDGVRGVAVIGVLLYHGGVGWLPGGFLGVDVFFVLSGFLITSLLLDERIIRLGRFWSRRAKRLFPGLVVLVAGACLYAATITPPDGRGGVRSDLLWALGYGANWHFVAASSSYFAMTAAPSPVAHTWSLAIEEQFYVLWPLVVLVTRRLRRPLAALAGVAGAGMVASTIEMAVLYTPGSDPSRVYYGTDTRCQVILAGALAATAVTAWRRRAVRPLGSTGAGRLLGFASVPAAAVVLWAMHEATGDSSWVYRGGFLAVSVLVALVIVAATVDPSNLVAKGLAWRPLRAVGLISYGLYLYHWPLYLVLDNSRTGLAGTPLLLVRLAASLAAATLSYYLVETPIRRRVWAGRRVAASSVVAGIVTAAAVVAATVGPSAAPAEPLRVALPSTTVAGVHQATTTTTSPGPISSVPAGDPLNVMFVGDSVAETLAVGMEAPSSAEGVKIDNEGVLGCGIVTDSPYRYFGGQYSELAQCLDWPQKWSSLVAAHRPSVVFLVVGRWEVMDRYFDGRWTHLGDPAFDAHVESLLQQAITVLSSSGAAVAVATAPYYRRGETPSGGRYPEDDPARVDIFNSLVRQAVASQPSKAVVVDLNAKTSVGGVYTPYIDGIEMRYDGVHFTPEADRWLTPWLLPQLEALAPRSG